MVDAMEGPFYPMFCLEPQDHTCFQDAHCGLQGLWTDVHVAVRAVFERTSMAELADRHRQRAAVGRVLAPADLVRPAGRAN